MRAEDVKNEGLGMHGGHGLMVVGEPCMETKHKRVYMSCIKERFMC
jgi:hypothetical protein